MIWTGLLIFRENSKFCSVLEITPDNYAKFHLQVSVTSSMLKDEG